MRTLPLLLMLGACADRYYPDTSGRLWAPESTVATDSGVYTLLPKVGLIARLDGSEEPAYIDMRGDVITSFSALPSGELLLRADHYSCKAEGYEGQPIDECPDLVTSENVFVADGLDVTDRSWPLEPGLGALRTSPDGTVVVALADPNADVSTGGIVNLTAMQVIRTDTDETWQVAIGFAASDVLFLTDASGATTQALVLAPDEIALVDLVTPAPRADVTFPLTLNNLSSATPSDVVVTPDGQFALVSIAGSSDLYVLDLIEHSINIIGLRGVPTDMLLDADGDRTFVVYRNVSVIEAIDHARFETTSWTVPQGLDHLDLTATAVIATRRDNGSLVHRIDRATDHLDTWALNYPSGELRIAPDGQWAITTPPSSARFELLTLEPDGSGRIDTDPRPFGVEGELSDVQFAERDGGTSALMFSGGSNQLLQLDWPALTGSAIEIAFNPVSIGEAPGIGWFITHFDPQGRITLLDLAGEATVVEGFATYAMLEPTLLEKEAQP